eukprot:4079857-Prymnesium_polylepis.1
MTAEQVPRVPEPPQSVDAVAIMNVLHHVAERTPAVLEQAAALARKYILIHEDYCHNPRSKHCYWLTHDHDDRAVYRSPAEWQEMFRRHCPQFRVIKIGHVMYKRSHLNKNNELVIGVSGGLAGQPGVVFYVLQREGGEPSRAAAYSSSPVPQQRGAHAR